MPSMLGQDNQEIPRVLHTTAAGLLSVSEFTPSAYAADLIMSATGVAVALATGAHKARIVNRGATTEAIRVVFGTSEANALANLTISSGAATTGVWIGAAADGFNPELILGVPSTATHIAVGPAVASDTQAVNVIQGV